ncbi:hypothetical protein [Flavobacterium sp. 7A]|uniref:hypothetical protein n=1 Tax=Flavobacterium sp. 7A TaxID=2940571 RepID=UPI002226265C|nr:hypothetical protein [Flavobacterium sp. 7A]MCW2121020.1 antitoxin component YwqK of YwqJK toxin-antitoxin module [Flavobacterium sp. 7A]
MNIKIYWFVLLLSFIATGQTSTQHKDPKAISNAKVISHYYRDSIVSMQLFMGLDKKMDSLKTYHANGKKNEVFYFDAMGLIDGAAEQYNKEGEKMVTTTFLHGKISNRIDYKIPFENTRQESTRNIGFIKQKNKLQPNCIKRYLHKSTPL